MCKSIWFLNGGISSNWLETYYINFYGIYNLMVRKKGRSLNMCIWRKLSPGMADLYKKKIENWMVIVWVFEISNTETVTVVRGHYLYCLSSWSIKKTYAWYISSSETLCYLALNKILVGINSTILMWKCVFSNKQKMVIMNLLSGISCMIFPGTSSLLITAKHLKYPWSSIWKLEIERKLE